MDQSRTRPCLLPKRSKEVKQPQGLGSLASFQRSRYCIRHLIANVFLLFFGSFFALLLFAIGRTFGNYRSDVNFDYSIAAQLGDKP
eukprot:scaffold41180_cov145-Amphora_coffeaeformis.AAC.2